MKRLFYFMLLITGSLFAQEDIPVFCLTPSSSPHINDLETIRGLDHTNDIFHLKIYVHVLRKETAPKLGQTREDINRQIKYLYDDFDPLGIHFVWDNYIDYIDNDEFYYDPDYYTNPNVFPNDTSPIFNTNNHSDGIDIYFFDIEQGMDSAIGGMFGRGDNIGGSAFILGGKFRGGLNGDEMIPSTWTKLISHEMGHILFLFHTFHGTSPLEQNATTCSEIVNPITDPLHPWYEEQVNNPSLCGDYIADTAADPGISWYGAGNPIYMEVNENCEYNPIHYPYDAIPDFDVNGDPYNPDPTNLMCYTYPTCYDGFTFGQKKRMKNAIWYLSVLHNTLIDDYTIIRATDDCFICDGVKDFYVYSTEDLNHLYPISSSNLSTQIVQQTNDYLVVRVTNNDPGAEEGARGDFSIVVSGRGMIVATQSVWVGLPQAVPENTVNGATEASAGNYVNHKIDDGYLRLEGIETYDWEFPEPNETYVYWGGPAPNDPTIWEYIYFSKYVPKVSSSVGDQSGYVRVKGKNPCGVGEYGIENEICVEIDGEPCEGGLPPIVYYPNPADSLLSVDLSLQAYDIFTVTVYNDSQVAVYTDQSENVVKTVDTFNLSNGTYYLHIYDSSNELILSRILIINH